MKNKKSLEKSGTFFSLNSCMLQCESANKFHEPFLWNTLLKLLERRKTEIKLFNIPCDVCKKY